MSLAYVAEDILRATSEAHNIGGSTTGNPLQPASRLECCYVSCRVVCDFLFSFMGRMGMEQQAFGSQ